MNYRFFIVLVLLGLAYLLREMLIILFVAFLLTTALLPVVQWLKQKRIPRALSSVILVFMLLVAPIVILVSLGPLIIEESRALASNIPELIKQVETRLDISISHEIEERFEANGGQIVSSIFTLTGSIAKLVVGFVLVMVITIYWLIYYQPVRTGLAKLAPDKQQERFVNATLAAIESRLGAWVKGQVLISLAIGILTWLVLLALGLPYAGVLAILAAILELVPTLGPILAAIPALFIALGISPSLALVVLAAYIGIQQVESYVIAPRLLSHAVKMNPFAILLSIIAGTQLLGLIGALIAVPATIMLHELYVAHNNRPAKH